jgi:hypothetical protein
MPIDVRIDPKLRIVFATPRGTMTHEDMVDYQQRVWSRRAMTGYDELIDMTEVDRVAFESPMKVMEIAELSADSDVKRSRAKIAIVAQNKLHIALGRMYQAYRGLSPGARATIQIFPTLEQAMGWLRPTRAKLRKSSALKARGR